MAARWVRAFVEWLVTGCPLRAVAGCVWAVFAGDRLRFLVIGGAVLTISCYQSSLEPQAFLRCAEKPKEINEGSYRAA